MLGDELYCCVTMGCIREDVVLRIGSSQARTFGGSPVRLALVCAECGQRLAKVTVERLPSAEQ